MNDILWNIFCWAMVVIHTPELMWYYISIACTELKWWWWTRGGGI